MDNTPQMDSEQEVEKAITSLLELRLALKRSVNDEKINDNHDDRARKKVNSMLDVLQARRRHTAEIKEHLDLNTQQMEDLKCSINKYLKTICDRDETAVTRLEGKIENMSSSKVKKYKPITERLSADLKSMRCALQSPDTVPNQADHVMKLKEENEALMMENKRLFTAIQAMEMKAMEKERTQHNEEKEILKMKREMQQTIDELKNENIRTIKEMKELQQENEQIKEKMDTERLDILLEKMEGQETVQKMNVEIVQKQQKVETLQKLNEEIKGKLAAERIERLEIEQNIQSAEQLNAELKDRITEMEGEHAEREKLEKLLAEFEVENERIQTEMANGKALTEKLFAENEQIQSQMEEIRFQSSLETSKMEAKYERIQEQNEGLKNQIKKHEQANSNAVQLTHEKFSKLEVEKSKLEQEVTKLKRQYETQRRKHNSVIKVAVRTAESMKAAKYKFLQRVKEFENKRSLNQREVKQQVDELTGDWIQSAQKIERSLHDAEHSETISENTVPEEEVRDLEAQIQRLQHWNENLMEKFTEMKYQIAETDKHHEIERSRKQSIHLEDKQQIDRLCEEIKSLREHVGAQKTMLKRSLSKLKKMSEEKVSMQNVENLNDQLQAKITGIEQKYTVQNETQLLNLKTLNQKLMTQKSKIIEFEKEKVHGDKLYAVLEGKLKELTDTNEKIKFELQAERLNKSLEDVEREKEASEIIEQIQRLQRRNEELKNEISKVTTEKQEAVLLEKEKVRELEQQKVMIEAALKKASQSIGDLIDAKANHSKVDSLRQTLCQEVRSLLNEDTKRNIPTNHCSISQRMKFKTHLESMSIMVRRCRAQWMQRELELKKSYRLYMEVVQTCKVKAFAETAKVSELKSMREALEQSQKKRIQRDKELKESHRHYTKIIGKCQKKAKSEREKLMKLEAQSAVLKEDIIRQHKVMKEMESDYKTHLRVVKEEMAKTDALLEEERKQRQQQIQMMHRGPRKRVTFAKELQPQRIQTETEDNKSSASHRTPKNQRIHPTQRIHALNDSIFETKNAISALNGKDPRSIFDYSALEIYV